MSEYTEWFEEKMKAQFGDSNPVLPHKRLIVLPWLLWAAFIGFAVGCVFYVSRVEAVPVAEASADGAKIVLTDEDCKLDAISNLKKRATWSEKGRVYEGCYGIHPDGFVLAYFADKTVVVIPVYLFKRVSGA